MQIFFCKNIPEICTYQKLFVILQRKMKFCRLPTRLRAEQASRSAPKEY